MFVQPIVLAGALSAGAAFLSSYACLACQQENVHILEANPTEIALKPEQASFPYSPPVWFEQLPATPEWSDLLPKPKLPSVLSIGRVLLDVYPAESELSKDKVSVA